MKKYANVKELKKKEKTTHALTPGNVYRFLKSQDIGLENYFSIQYYSANDVLAVIDKKQTDKFQKIFPYYFMNISFEETEVSFIFESMSKEQIQWINFEKENPFRTYKNLQRYRAASKDIISPTEYHYQLFTNGKSFFLVEKTMQDFYIDYRRYMYSFRRKEELPLPQDGKIKDVFTKNELVNYLGISPYYFQQEPFLQLQFPLSRQDLEQFLKTYHRSQEDVDFAFPSKGLCSKSELERRYGLTKTVVRTHCTNKKIVYYQFNEDVVRYDIQRFEDVVRTRIQGEIVKNTQDYISEIEFAKYLQMGDSLERRVYLYNPYFKEYRERYSIYKINGEYSLKKKEVEAFLQDHFHYKDVAKSTKKIRFAPSSNPLCSKADFPPIVGYYIKEAQDNNQIAYISTNRESRGSVKFYLQDVLNIPAVKQYIQNKNNKEIHIRIAKTD